MIATDEEYLDFSRVPESRGVPKAIVYAGSVGLFMIFCIGAATCLFSGYGHHWPEPTSMRVDLGPLHE
ncbi:MAG: hypothetical protein ABI231_08155 [Candidatus Tumulicola sp.]